jgi:hypothetical protein
MGPGRGAAWWQLDVIAVPAGMDLRTAVRQDTQLLPPRQVRFLHRLAILLI